MHTYSTVYRCESALHGGIYDASFDRILHFKNYLVQGILCRVQIILASVNAIGE